MPKLSYLLFLFLLTGLNSSAFGELIDQNDADTINRCAPSDLQNIRDAITKGDEDTEVSAFIKLANRVDNQISGLDTLTRDQLNDSHVFYWFVWNIGIKMFATLSGNQEKEKLLFYWNNCLGKKSANIQIAALGRTMNRNFLTPRLLSLLRETNDPSILRAFAYVIWQQGNDDDAKLLKEKMTLLKSDKYKGILQNGLNWRNYRLNKSLWGDIPGPPREAPQPF